MPTPKKLRLSVKERPTSTRTSEDYHKLSSRRKSSILGRKRKESSSDNEDNDEVNKFTKYISCLLKTVPNDLCTKLQLDIINLIMTAKLKHQENNSKLQENDSGHNQNFPPPVIYSVGNEGTFQEQKNPATVPEPGTSNSYYATGNESVNSSQN